MPTKSFNHPFAAGVPAAAGTRSEGSDGDRRLAVMCVMLSRGQGGLEQSQLDYCEALSGAGEQVVALVHPDWPGIAELDRLGIETTTFGSLGEWDLLAAARLRRLLFRRAPDVALTIGRRASTLVRRALARGPGPLHVAVTPNYSLAHLIGLQHVIATTHDLKRVLVEAGQPERRISVIPNMIRLPEPPAAPPVERGEAPVIGALGRLVAKKGFVDLIDALARLRAQGHEFTVRLGGEGPEAAALRAKVAAHELADRVEFFGWITDKRGFFEALDIFCVPSLHEPFGMVVLEGLAYGRPMVVTDAEGPSEILQDGVNGLIVPRGDPERLAAALARLLEDASLRARLASEGLRLVRQKYALPVVGKRLSTVLRAVAGARETSSSELARP